MFIILAGLLEPDAGSLVYRGESVESLRGRIGYMMPKDELSGLLEGAASGT